MRTRFLTTLAFLQTIAVTEAWADDRADLHSGRAEIGILNPDQLTAVERSSCQSIGISNPDLPSEAAKLDNEGCNILCQPLADAGPEGRHPRRQHFRPADGRGDCRDVSRTSGWRMDRQPRLPHPCGLRPLCRVQARHHLGCLHRWSPSCRLYAIGSARHHQGKGRPTDILPRATARATPTKW